MAAYQTQQRSGVELFVGLGPQGGNITEQAIKAKLEESGIALLDVRKRGTAAFVDVANADQAEQVISKMNGQFIGEARLAVNLSNGGSRGGRGGGGAGFSRGGRGGDSAGYSRGRGAGGDYGRGAGGYSRGAGGGAQQYSTCGIEVRVGLGPNGATISEQQLSAFLARSAEILAIRHRGVQAFVDVATAAQAEKLINELNGQSIGEVRLAIKLNGDRRPRN